LVVVDDLQCAFYFLGLEGAVYHAQRLKFDFGEVAAFHDVYMFRLMFVGVEKELKAF
jgi:hypothetical protein